jgi:hypothetical protein
MSPPTRLVTYARALGDDQLNDLLVELPPERFAVLLEDAFTAPQVGIPVRYHPARPRPGEASRWTVEAYRLLQPPEMHGQLPAWRMLGAVVRQQTAGPRGGRPVAWHARTYRDEPVGDPGGRGWPTRDRAAAALLWHCPASGARCHALAGHVRALGDHALGDLLADLPPRRFAALLLAALDLAGEGGVAA